jgi:hypothetical protein
MLDITEGKDYIFVEKETSDFYSIKLLSGDWSNLVYTYGKVQLKEDPKNDCATLSFDYKIEEYPTNLDISFESDPKFRDYLGNVLANIITESEFKIGTDGTESSIDHHKESNSERGLLS